jgi:hypothetical protein
VAGTTAQGPDGRLVGLGLVDPDMMVEIEAEAIFDR